MIKSPKYIWKFVGHNLKDYLPWNEEESKFDQCFRCQCFKTFFLCPSRFHKISQSISYWQTCSHKYILSKKNISVICFGQVPYFSLKCQTRTKMSVRDKQPSLFYQRVLDRGSYTDWQSLLAKLLVVSRHENDYLTYFGNFIDIREYIDCSLVQPACLVLVDYLCCQPLLSCGATSRCKTKKLLYCLLYNFKFKL